MVVVREPCPRCGADADAGIHQGMRFGDCLAWSRSVRCSACSYAEQADHGGDLPPAYRAQILAQEGAWEVVVPRADDRGKVAVAARAALALDLAGALQLARAVPGVVWTGTQVEVAWFGCQLARHGVVSLTRPTSPR